MQDPEEERVRSGRGEFARVGETISFVLVGGISVLMCLSVEKARSRVQESGWSPDLLEVVLG
jgi:hypothetical protein